MTPNTDTTIPTLEDVGAAQSLAKLDEIEGKARERLGIVAGARRVLSDEFFIAVMDRLEEEYIELWRACREKDERERYHVRLEVLDDIKSAFEICAQGEKTASQVLDQIADKRKFFADKKVRYAS